MNGSYAAKPLSPITPNILLPFYTVLKRYILFWLLYRCGSKPLCRLKLPLFSNLEPSGVTYALSIVAVEGDITWNSLNPQYN